MAKCIERFDLSLSIGQWSRQVLKIQKYKCVGHNVNLKILFSDLCFSA